MNNLIKQNSDKMSIHEQKSSLWLKAMESILETWYVLWTKVWFVVVNTLQYYFVVKAICI